MRVRHAKAKRAKAKAPLVATEEWLHDWPGDWSWKTVPGKDYARYGDRYAGWDDLTAYINGDT